MPKPQTLVEKILAEHLVDGSLDAAGQIGITIDQTLTQDATGTTAFLLFEAMGIERVKTEVSVSYVDHNMAQFGPENHNDHLYLQSVARKVGAWHSRPGNGICHQVHLERFGRPGGTLLGSDSHTPTNGGMGMIAIGAGGLDVAVAMGGGAFYLPTPRVIGVELKGALRPWVAAKDIILRLLSVLTTRGNVGCIVEYFGEGVADLSVPARSTCTNMGAELGVTTSVFPSDERTRQFLAAQGREGVYRACAADEGARYGPVEKRLHLERDAGTIETIREFCTDVQVGEADSAGFAAVRFGHVVIDLDALEPLAACPQSPENIRPVKELGGTEVRQVLVGSCTNSSFQDLTMVSEALRGRTVAAGVELGIAPGSRQVLRMIGESGALANLVASGARILESACGPCIGQGFSPGDGAVSVRSFNRNFPGRSGTKADLVYLTSPETCVAAALTGRLTDPRELEIDCPRVAEPESFLIDDSMLQPPLEPAEAPEAEILRGPTIVKPPSGEPLPDAITGDVVIKVGDKITTDHISPAGTLLKYRSNVPEYAKYVFSPLNTSEKPTFAQRAIASRDAGRAAIIVGGDSYGQGSSREHAALCPMFLGVRIVLAKTIERIHQANLVNFAILPLTFADESDYDAIEEGDELTVEGLAAAIESAETLILRNVSRGREIVCNVSLAPRQRKILAAGGLLNFTGQQAD
jgi:aconitate hydratase